MAAEKTLPALWLLSDARNDLVLDERLRAFGQQIAFVYRHYHLPPQQRYGRYRHLARIARSEGHLVILSDSALTAKEWGADGIYGPPRALAPRRAGLLGIATAHDMAELAAANIMGADAAMLSPVFATNSHPGAPVLGAMRFLAMAQHAAMPVIALGGMNRRNALRLDWPRWAAIDGLSS